MCFSGRLFIPCPVKSCADNHNGWCINCMDYADCVIYEEYDLDDQDQWVKAEKEIQEGKYVYNKLESDIDG